MEAIVILFILGSLLIGGTFGYLAATYAYECRNVGTLRVDRSDPDGPYLFLELKQHPEIVSRHKQVVLDVKNENYISQE